ncbi:hypothetical protein Mapa_010250 [Marchantia paleacea]|nr:hypothetical protein Mapa_010250 [Marchantia paleacea]
MRTTGIGALLGCSIGVFLLGSCFAGFSDEFTANWGRENIVADDATRGVRLSLTEVAGAHISSSNSFLFGSFKVKLKLIAGESAGTVSSFYLYSSGTKHDEIDFEFLGNETGQPYLLHTNVFANGVGNREQRISLWFDPTADFHTYSVIWNHHQITWLVDDTPIRIHKNIEDVLPNTYPKSQPMTVQASIFEASSWATRGGAVPIEWESAPFVVNYKEFSFDACVASNNDISSCTRNYEENWWEAAEHHALNPSRMSQLKNVRQNFMVYDYCTDKSRYSTAPTECSYNGL